MDEQFERWWARNHPNDWWAKEREGDPLPTHDRLRVWHLAREAYLAGTNEKLIECLEYWLPDETMVSDGHEEQWHEAHETIREARARNALKTQ